MDIIRVRMNGVILPNGWKIHNVSRGYRGEAYQVTGLEVQCRKLPGVTQVILTVPIPETGDVIVDFPVDDYCKGCSNELICLMREP